MLFSQKPKIGHIYFKHISTFKHAKLAERSNLTFPKFVLPQLGTCIHFRLSTEV